MLDFVNYLAETIKGGTHIEHPEDLVFMNGSKGSSAALEALNGVIARPDSITIKWDGYPALVFGRNHDGQLIVVDKHMFTKKDGSGRRVTSVEQFVAYDQARGVNRADLYESLAKLWLEFEQAVPQNIRGYYWGDLLWVNVPHVQNGGYIFQPNTVQYQIPVNSELGKRIGKSGGGIVVHQFMQDFDTPPQTISGTGGLNTNGPLCILTSHMSDKLNLKVPVQQEKKARLVIQKYGSAVDTLIDKINLSSIKCTDLPQLMKTYVNSRIRGETRGFLEWIPEKLSIPKQQRLLGENKDGYLYQNIQGVVGAFEICTAVESVKNNIVYQLDAQQKTIKSTVNGVSGGEGYVVNTGAGLLKLVNRSHFSAANFAKNMK
jgi:hypothetical protein